MRLTERGLLFFSMALLLIMGSCSPKSSSEDAGDAMNIAFKNLQDSVWIPDNFPHIKCVQLEMTDESILGRVEKVIDFEGILIVFADNEIFAFDKSDGKFIRRIGNIGEGPEEYISIRDICVDPEKKTILAYDRLKNEFISYRLDGEFVGREKAAKDLTEMRSMVRTPDGTLLACNFLSPAKYATDHAFSLIENDGKVVEIDPFAPVFSDDVSATWAAKPMSACGNELKFIKFLGDTVFSIKDNKISPLYKLDFGKGIPTKKRIAQNGSFPGKPHYKTTALEKNELTGIDKIYETSELLVMLPHIYHAEGYYWIDKRNNNGFYIDSVSESEVMTNRVVEGKAIIQIVGSNENEFICCFGSYPDAEILEKSIQECKDKVIFPNDVISTIRNVDKEGNPFLIIYSR